MFFQSFVLCVCIFSLTDGSTFYTQRSVPCFLHWAVSLQAYSVAVSTRSCLILFNGRQVLRLRPAGILSHLFSQPPSDGHSLAAEIFLENEGNIQELGA